jgi:hypothetical protein
MAKKYPKFRDHFGNELEIVPQTTGHLALFVENYETKNYGKIFLNKEQAQKLKKVI